MNWFRKPWSPYIAGGLVGLLAITSVVISTQLLAKPKYLGTSTTMVRLAGLAESQVASDHVSSNEYFQSKKIKVDWQMMLVVGIVIGAFLAAIASQEFKSETVPTLWKARFGPKWHVRALGAFLGGILAILGARLAGGCPSGHGLSGMMQLAGSGLLAMVGFMAGGILAANCIYRKGGN
ncbi:MAG: YeeE/YedE family protein [Phycisphaerales bacterium]|jgi:uncharacterized protein|nr:YeeE/YedE family protein [Phycisphaerales bacterium]MBT7172007.1 YeeE/YedE family protein [Phycisphaerales bacterium]